MLNLKGVFSSIVASSRAVRYHPKYAYHDTIALVSRYTLGIDTLPVLMIRVEICLDISIPF